MQDFDLATSPTPLYGTQGGGLATLENGRYVWHSDIPQFLTDAQIGDPIPDKWSVVPANQAAHHEVERNQAHEEDEAWSDHLYGEAFCSFCGNAGCGYCFGSH